MKAIIDVPDSPPESLHGLSDASTVFPATKPSSLEAAFQNLIEAAFQTLITRVQTLEARVEANSHPTSNGSIAPAQDRSEYPAARTTNKAASDRVTISVPEDRGSLDVSRADSEASFSEADNKDLEITNKILDIIENYGVREETSQPCMAKENFLPVVLNRVRKEEPISLVLPAFPFKSPNRKSKVLGNLPDLGEEIALATLQNLCNNIRQVYEHGAKVIITSDGFVYNDLLDVPDSDVWAYGEAVRDMAKRKKFEDIQFSRLSDILDTHPRLGTNSHPPSAEENRIYNLTHAGCFRRELVARYEPAGFDAKQAIRDDIDTRLTYRGYLRFLKKDLEHREDIRNDADGNPLSAKKYDKVISAIAQRMITRGAAFAGAIRAVYGDCVRLSIHPTLAINKFPVQLIPQEQGTFGPTPWHSSIAVGLDGSFKTGHVEDLSKTYDVVLQNGQPYFFREKSDLFDWGDLKVEFEHLYPCGLIIRPVEGSPSARSIPIEKVRQLSVNLSPVVLRGFSDTLEESVYVEKAHEAGKVLPWTFGIIQKVKDAGDNTKAGNNVTSNEGMPMHFDGMFKFEERTDPVTGEVTKVQIPPGYQFFTALATAPEGTGYTLFASSRLFFQYLRSPYNAERFEKIRWGMDNDGFWNAKLKDLPLIVRHPVTNAPCLRWHEPWDETKTKFSTCKVTLANDDEEIIDVVTKLLYDYRVCLRFTWNVGDWLVSDNTSMLHTRTGYTSGCERELWRIHFD
ncbi:putative pyoverdine/dityrosine biosynthesis protein [Xylogone sp. PMI_703]|nr:putative pyoverdine/dityrosine biosynthesis protein [Xylogone sp. PMI_703]